MGKAMNSRPAFVLVASVFLTACGGSGNSNSGPLANAPKVIMDSDFNTMGDDGQLFAMTTQLMAQGKVNLLGLTVVTGNDWLLQEQADAQKAVDGGKVRYFECVCRGANYPLQYNVAS